MMWKLTRTWNCWKYKINQPIKDRYEGEYRRVAELPISGKIINCLWNRYLQYGLLVVANSSSPIDGEQFWIALNAMFFAVRYVAFAYVT